MPTSPAAPPMDIRADEISRILREQIQDYGKKVTVAETGTVLSQGDGIARVYGLEGVLSGELVEFKNGVQGLVLNLEEDNVGVAIMGEFSAHPRGRHRQAHPADRLGPGRQGAARPGGERARRAGRRQGPDQRHRDAGGWRSRRPAS